MDGNVRNMKTTWRREGGKDIVLRTEGRDKQCKYATFYLLKLISISFV